MSISISGTISIRSHIEIDQVCYLYFFLTLVSEHPAPCFMIRIRFTLRLTNCYSNSYSFLTLVSEHLAPCFCRRASAKGRLPQPPKPPPPFPTDSTLVAAALPLHQADNTLCTGRASPAARAASSDAASPAGRSHTIGQTHRPPEAHQS